MSWVVEQDVASLDAAIAEYLRFKKKRLTDKSAIGYEAPLRELALFFPGHGLDAFAPPAGTHLIEDFLNVRWGEWSARTYNKNLSVIHNFFGWQSGRGRIQGDPTLPIEKAKTRPFHRTTFGDAQRVAIFDANSDLRDSLGLRLLLDYGIRKGALRGVRLEHFDQARGCLAIFTKGEKWLTVRIPDPDFWDDVDRLVAAGAQPAEYLIPWEYATRRKIEAPAARIAGRIAALLRQSVEACGELDELLGDEPTRRFMRTLADAQAALLGVQMQRERRRRKPLKQISERGAHDWWYRALARAGIVAEGVRSGERMHKARHSAAQRVYDATGDIKVVQNMLGHASPQTTLAVYVGSSDDQLDDALYQVIVEPRDGKRPKRESPVSQGRGD